MYVTCVDVSRWAVLWKMGWHFLVAGQSLKHSVKPVAAADGVSTAVKSVRHFLLQSSWLTPNRPTSHLIIKKKKPTPMWLWLVINYAWRVRLALSGRVGAPGWGRVAAWPAVGGCCFGGGAAGGLRPWLFCCMWTWAFLAHQHIPRSLEWSASAFCAFPRRRMLCVCERGGPRNHAAPSSVSKKKVNAESKWLLFHAR